jgi:hypothetical protein
VPSYRVAPLFLIRIAGAPFDVLEAIATPQTFVAAREVLVRRKAFAAAKADADTSIQSRERRLPPEAFRAWRAAVRAGQLPIALAEAPPSEFAGYAGAAGEVTRAESHLQQTLERELISARVALLEAARKLLPGYLIFGAEHVRELVPKLLAMAAVTEENLPPRKKILRARDRHLLLFLQRIAAKNDTLSEFGPTSWGGIDLPDDRGQIDFASGSGITKRESFLERWAAHGIAAAMNADPMVRVELSPRLHPSGRIEGEDFVFTETGEGLRLDPQTLSILARCDGTTPAHSLGVELEKLARLADQKMIRWEVEVPALSPHAFDVLVADVKRWREGPTRTRWLELLEPIAELAHEFIHTNETAARMEMMDKAREALQRLGTTRASDRFLYSAINPIGEECFRETGFTISRELINEVGNDAAPWIDLWRDCYAFIAGRVAEGLRGLLEKAAVKNGALPLPSFLRHCESLKMPLTGPAMVGFAHIAFQEVKSVFRERMKPHVDQAEYELTPDDCHFIRQNFRYEKFDEYTYPSADLQLAADSIGAIARGDYQWILAELHPPVALLHHGFYWSCPDKAALSAALARTAFGKPNFYFGFYAADFTATTTVCLPEAVPNLTWFVAPQRGASHWRTISPAEAEVYVDQRNGDVCLRQIGTGEFLGSFARAGWLIPLGFHPFQFGMAPQMPRLRCGKIIVQRRAWIMREEELGAGDFTGVSRDLVLAVERLRGERDLPRFIYIRPTEQALRRSGAEGRDKDTKPVFVDLESYLFLEIFHRWLAKWNELEVTEMLPTPDQLLWHEPDGRRRNFELRTLIVPQ